MWIYDSVCHAPFWFTPGWFVWAGIGIDLRKFHKISGSSKYGKCQPHNMMYILVLQQLKRKRPLNKHLKGLIFGQLLFRAYKNCNSMQGVGPFWYSVTPEAGPGQHADLEIILKRKCFVVLVIQPTCAPLHSTVQD